MYKVSVTTVGFRNPSMRTCVWSAIILNSIVKIKYMIFSATKAVRHLDLGTLCFKFCPLCYALISTKHTDYGLFSHLLFF